VLGKEAPTVPLALYGYLRKAGQFAVDRVL
jgi:hypothetical protein